MTVPLHHGHHADCGVDDEGLHAWLAWQAHPDAGIGPAIDKGFLSAMSPAADTFVAWFEQTFA